MRDARPATAMFYLLIAGGIATRQELADVIGTAGPGPYEFSRPRLAVWAAELADMLEEKPAPVAEEGEA